MEYTLRIKRYFFWRKYKVVGHAYVESQDKLDVFFKDGSVESIPSWSKHRLKLGQDWKLAVKEKMEKETGTNIKVNGEL